MIKYLIPIIIISGCQPSDKNTETAKSYYSIDTISSDKTFNEYKEAFDSSRLLKINDIKTSVLSSLNQYNLIVRIQEDGECFGKDSLYYDDSKELVAFIGYSGCLVETSAVKSIYNDKELVYSHFTNDYDGLTGEEIEIYFNEGRPLYGSQKKNNWDFATRKHIDSTFRLLTVQELTRDFKLQIQPDEKLKDVLERIWILKGHTTPSRQVLVRDSLQQYVESLEFIMDSVVYHKLIDD